MGQVISYHQKTLFFFQAWLPCFAFLCTAEALSHATKRDSGKIGGHMVLVIGPFCSAIQAKWIGRPLTWLGDLESLEFLLIGVSGVFVVLEFLLFWCF